jgi:hypothetical protein
VHPPETAGIAAVTTPRRRPDVGRSGYVRADERGSDAVTAEDSKPPKGVWPGGHRRIDRVLGDDYLKELGSLGLAELRSRRDDARQEQADLSYLRRMLHGRIDLLDAEQQRRRGGSARRSLVDELPRILADQPTGSEGTDSSAARARARHLSVEPSRVDAHRRRVEALIADVAADDLAASSDEELTQSLAAFREAEADVSETRRLVQQAMDACTAEIGRRYRDGEAGPADMLAPPG